MKWSFHIEGSVDTQGSHKNPHAAPIQTGLLVYCMLTWIIQRCLESKAEPSRMCRGIGVLHRMIGTRSRTLRALELEVRSREQLPKLWMRQVLSSALKK